MSNVKYKKSQREHAKAKNVRLYTVSVTEPGGKGEITYQGPCDDDFAKKLHEIVAEKRKKEASSNG